MKKLFLLVASSSIAASSFAQLKVTPNASSPLSVNVDMAKHMARLQERTHSAHNGTAAKTTAASPRWYSYTNYFNQNETATSSSIDWAFPYLWGTADAYMSYSGGFDTTNFISYSMIFDPAFGTTNNGFNSYDYYPGETKVTATDAYTIDSISFAGWYETNPAKFGGSGYVDTIRVTLVSGNGTASANVRTGTTTVTAGDLLTNYGAAVGSSFEYQYMPYSGTKKSTAGTPNFTYDILLNNTTTPPSWAADTTSEGILVKDIQVSPAFNVAAGNMVGVAVTFISGDPNFTPGDTVFFGSTHTPILEYNMFRPAVAYRGSGTTVNWLTYNMADRNTGGYVDRISTGAYIPHWFWSAGSSPATAQYPDIAFRLGSCATCGVIMAPSKVEGITSIERAAAYPNPAAGEINVPFVLNNSADVTVTLTNMLGQVVATKVMGNVAKGVATFDVNNLSNGLYTYAVVAGGQRTTGRVAVAH